MNHQSEEDFMRDPLVTKTERTFRNKFRSKLLLLTVAVTFAVSIFAFFSLFCKINLTSRISLADSTEGVSFDSAIKNSLTRG